MKDKCSSPGCNICIQVPNCFPCPNSFLFYTDVLPWTPDNSLRPKNHYGVLHILSKMLLFPLIISLPHSLRCFYNYNWNEIDKLVIFSLDGRYIELGCSLRFSWFGFLVCLFGVFFCKMVHRLKYIAISNFI